MDIASFACRLDFGSRMVTLKGLPAHEIFATLLENGIPSEGAAGTIYVATGAVKCEVMPAEIVQKNGCGATCSFSL